MGRTSRRYRITWNCNHHTGLKASRNSIPVAKRNSHHRFRHVNRYSDQILWEKFNQDSFKDNARQKGRSVLLINGRYNFQSFFTPFNKDPDTELSMKAKLQKKIQSGRKELKACNYAPNAAKNGLRQHDLLQMAWKMLKRRGTLQPFQGHRQRGFLYKRQSAF